MDATMRHALHSARSGLSTQSAQAFAGAHGDACWLAARRAGYLATTPSGEVYLTEHGRNALAGADWQQVNS